MRQDTKDGFYASAWFIWAVVLICAVVLGIFAFRVWFAPQIGEGQKRINTNNGRYIEAAYNRYYDECEAIVSNEVQQANFKRQLDQAKKSGDADAAQRAQVNYDAIVNEHASLVTEYNADSSKTGTLAQHKAADLPWNIDPNSKEPTKCAR